MFIFRTSESHNEWMTLCVNLEGGGGGGGGGVINHYVILQDFVKLT